MSRGLTDRESLGAVMKEVRDERAAVARVKELASKGLHTPLSSEETHELCDSVLRRIGRLAPR